MKEMNFPIDIIWLDDNWRVIDLTKNISEKDFPKIYQPRLPARYVLEVNAGFIAKHHIILMARGTLDIKNYSAEVPSITKVPRVGIGTVQGGGTIVSGSKHFPPGIARPSTYGPGMVIL